MSLSGSKDAHDSSSLGKVDGRDAKITYYRDAEVRKLSYSLSTADQDHNVENIQGDCIIGIAPVKDSSSGEYSLFYVEVTPSEDSDSKDAPKVEARTYFHTLTLANPPAEFVQDYTAVDSSMWAFDSAQDQSTSSETNLFVIASTGSGHGLAETVYKQVLQPFLDAISGSKQHNYFTTTSPSTVADFTTSKLLPAANAGTPQAVILLSGDGGIVDLVNALLFTPRSSNYVAPTLAILPLGTGNALANSSGANRDQTLGLSTLFRGSSAPLPLFHVHITPDSSSSGSNSTQTQAQTQTQMHGAVVFSWGLHASLVSDSDTPEYRKHGSARFQMAAKDLLSPPDGSAPHAYKARVEVLRPRPGPGSGSGSGSGAGEGEVKGAEHWEPVQREAHGYVLATLVSQLEKGFTVSPASKPLDARLRLVHFGAPDVVSGEDIMGVMGAAYQGGKHVEDPKVGYEEVEGVRVVFDGREDDGRWRRVCVDGTIVEVGREAVVEVRMARGLDLVELVYIKE